MIRSLSIGATALALVLASTSARAQVVLSTAGAASTESFDSLSKTGPSSALPTGWAMDGDTQYSSDTGTGVSGGIYSYGAAASSDRALGMIQSSTVTPTIGARFRNSTGVTITSLRIAYVGEQWRLGGTDRADRLDFQYSVNATSLSTGSWTNVDALDFTSPITTGVTGAKDGNASANRTALTATISGLNIANGADFWIRWSDLNVTGADDGLAVDDFSITPNPAGLLANGASCTLSGECTSGTCVDNVCCATACDLGACDACSVAAGADTNGVCKVLVGATCNDGDACTTGDTCSATGCGGTPVVCTASDECHVAGTCSAGTCSNPAKADGTPCATGTCNAGVCTAPPTDAGPADTGPADSGADTSPPDSGAADGSAADSGAADADIADSSVVTDSAVVADTGVADTTAPDSAAADGAVVDSTVVDAISDGSDASDTAAPADGAVTDTEVADTEVADTEVTDSAAGGDSGAADASDTGEGLAPTDTAEEGSCSCRTTGGGESAGAWLACAALALVAARRRRS